MKAFLPFLGMPYLSFHASYSASKKWTSFNFPIYVGLLKTQNYL